MFLPDTNVLSELRKDGKRGCDPNVLHWARKTPRAMIFLSSICLMELEIGTLLIARRDPAQAAMLRTWIDLNILSAFEGRILAVDAQVARRCAALHVPDPMPERDALIAATALVHGLTVVTRNVRDFERTGVPILDPWNP